MMRLKRNDLREIVYGARGWGRFTQDSPVMPDVWFGYGASPKEPLDLLIEPYRGVRPGKLAEALGKRFKKANVSAAKAGLAYEERYVVARLTFEEMVRLLLPTTRWWKGYTGPIGDLSAGAIESALADPEVQASGAYAKEPREHPTGHGVWFLRLAGTIAWAAARKGDAFAGKLPLPRACSRALAPVLAGLEQDEDSRPLLWSINRNRKANIAVWDSRKTIKADAADQIFGLDVGHLAWAIFDTGIDALHPAFRKRDDEGVLKPAELKHSRVHATYDFTRIRELVQGRVADSAVDGNELRRRLKSGRSIDWEMLEPEIRISHEDDDAYRSAHTPAHPHGTHVAGILGGDWRLQDAEYEADDSNDMLGVCPGIRLYDFRVLDEDGEGSEFAILAALQFVRHLNAQGQRPAIQGVNLSLSIPHDVSNYACGRTPVCNEAERLQASGVVVVAAAGNQGYVQYLTAGGESSAYRNISITDPGNAEAVLTVGATHGRRPHTYGISYFSSRGPTGDGRMKPDLVAPGEKIKGPAPNGTYERFDGTSMAAPHVSGAAAMIMSRHAEFIGDPDRIKQILCDTATDLGRERHFQGAGLVDVFRALQSI